MRKMGFFERFVNFVVRHCVLGLIAFITLVALSKQIAQEKKNRFKSESFEVGFSHFSPAYAAFEDDYLFPEGDQSELISGNTVVFEKLLKQTQPKATQVTEKNKKADKDLIFEKFDGGESLKEAQSFSKKIKASGQNLFVSKTEKSKKKSKIKMAGQEMGSGNLVALARSTPRVHYPQINPQPVAQPKVKPNNKPPQTVDPSSVDPETPAKDRYVVSGGIRLKDGLAFIGSMEVSWVVGDHELAIGSINVPDAQFEIEVGQLLGDIIVSLYDSNDELVGEGVFDLTKVPKSSEDVKTNIDVFPIDWDHAGQIVHSDGMGTGVFEPVKDVNVALYSFNDATTSDANGAFYFYNWKKTNSRTLAIASKEGFKDSIFMLDSRAQASVTLVTEKYASHFFKYIQKFDIYDVDEKGTVIGEIAGLENRGGYQVRLENNKPIYFHEIGLARIDTDKTSSNGMFAFVGLQDGDYELFIEKAGEVLDKRIVVVEQGKFSPVRIDLAKVKKHLEFFDPLNPEEDIGNADLSFFDGMDTYELKQNRAPVLVNKGSDPSILDFDTPLTSSKTFVSRNKGLQKVPFISDKKILELAKEQKFELEKGLLIGFVESEEKYLANMVENPVEKIIYFDSGGAIIDPKEEVAFGFIMGGYPEGLSSIFLETLEDETILGTDLIFSDHESISVMHFNVLPLE